MPLNTLVLAMVVVVLTLLVALAVGALVRLHPSLNGPVQAAMGGVVAMVALMALLVAVTR
jgi:flagellar biosynthesis protein FliR